MTHNGSNQYGNPVYTVPRQQQVYGGMQGMPGQQPIYPLPPQPLPTHQPTQQTQYVGGPLEASGGLLVPVGQSQGGMQAGSMQGGGPANQIPGMLPLNQSYIENILRLNKGKMVTIYMTFENNVERNSKTFRGILEAAGRDHIIISDPQTGKRYLLLMVHLDYITFDEEIEYEYPFNNTMTQQSTR